MLESKSHERKKLLAQLQKIMDEKDKECSDLKSMIKHNIERPSQSEVQEMVKKSELIFASKMNDMLSQLEQKEQVIK